MAVRTHDNSWRMLVSFAPLLGVAFIALGALQGEPEILSSPTVMAVLGAVAALSALVAWWTTYQLRAVAITPVASTQPGQAALRGLARALPDATPLLSPDGVACLWFHHGETSARRYDAWDSVRPFLLVDGSGQCVVLPAGANITGGATSGTRERRLHEGDPIHVAGRFVPISSEAIEAQQEAAALAAQTEHQRLVVRTNDQAQIERMLAQGPPSMPASPLPATPLGLPVLAKPGGAQPFIISIGSQEGQGGFYKFAAVLDTLVLCGAAVMYWLLTRGA